MNEFIKTFIVEKTAIVTLAVFFVSTMILVGIYRFVLIKGRTRRRKIKMELNHTNHELSWEIDSAEKKDRTKMAIIFTIPFIFFLFINSILDSSNRQNGYYFDTNLALTVFILIIISFLLAFLYNYFFPYPVRKYIINNNGIIVKKGNRERNFYWEEFEYFFCNPYEIIDRKRAEDNEIKRYYENLRRVRGESFFLKLKEKGMAFNLLKDILVIYSEPDNTDTVYSVLKNRLTEKTGIFRGIVKYHFR